MASYDEAKSQWRDDFKQAAGRDPFDEDLTDFENKWRKTPDYHNSQSAYGDNPVERPGIDDVTQQRDWGSLRAETQRDLAERFATDSGGGEFRDGGSGGGGSRDQALSQVSQQYSSASNDALSGFLKQMQDRDAAQQAERGQLRGILMSQLGGLSQPVSRDDPAMRGLFDSQRLSSQRESERQRSAAAESLGSRGLSDSGAMDTTLLGIDEKRAEQNVGFEGQTLYNEMNNRRQALQSLLSQALQVGDAEAARSIQATLNAMQMQQNDSHFNDDSAYRYAALMAGLNSGAVSPFL